VNVPPVLAVNTFGIGHFAAFPKVSVPEGIDSQAPLPSKLEHHQLQAVQPLNIINKNFKIKVI
jgi:hypothetical protein